MEIYTKEMIDKKLRELEEKQRQLFESQLKDLKNKQKDELTTDFENQLKKLKEKQEEELKHLENKVNKKRWIIDEYKWMPYGSSMPNGWVRVELNKGETIVQGNSHGSTPGNVGKHNHFFGNREYIWCIGKHDSGKSKLLFMNSTTGSTQRHYVPFVVNYRDSSNIKNTSFEGQGMSDTGENLAAGIYAELWQYQG